MEKNAPDMLKLWAMREGRKLGWVAGQIPVNQADLSRWINGKVKPRRIYRIRIAELTRGAVPVEAWE
ncbi:MAG: hypothetical protein MUD11_07410 [Rhodobacteraceae bacterium]|jgi:hypothetical protein|nr:hypothetical protein [Paracoccaceae bacterium]